MMTFAETVGARSCESWMTKDTRGGDRPSHDAIARLAYHFYEERGYERGHDVQDWLAAERELTRYLGFAP
jgi:hypothetical protein